MSVARKMHLGLFVMTAGHHVAAWRRPEAYRGDLFSEFAELARMAEAAKLDLFFIADSLSTRIANREAAQRSAHNFSPSILEPITLITASMRTPTTSRSGASW